MKRTSVDPPVEDHTQTHAFYRDVLQLLNRAGLPYVVGGGYALKHYTGVNRHTKDIDIFIDRADVEPITALLAEHGYETELTFPHWLAKTYSQGEAIDLVFSSGNGISEVDKSWFAHAVPAEVLGIPTWLCPGEEMIWSKAFIMERERFDGADIAHLLLACGEELDWVRLLERFTPHWRLLLSHLILFGFIYPAQRNTVPMWVMDELISCLRHEILTQPEVDETDKHLCAGTLLSREQYLNDIHRWGFEDARVQPRGKMTAQDAATWTDAIEKKKG